MICIHNSGAEEKRENKNGLERNGMDTESIGFKHLSGYEETTKLTLA
jgi:hypothetical protein